MQNMFVYLIYVDHCIAGLKKRSFLEQKSTTCNKIMHHNHFSDFEPFSKYHGLIPCFFCFPLGFPHGLLRRDGRRGKSDLRRMRLHFALNFERKRWFLDSVHYFAKTHTDRDVHNTILSCATLRQL